MNSLDPYAALGGADLPATAANDDAGPASAADGRLHEPPPPTRGWDAFEVWRTRVRDARRGAHPRRPG